VYAGGLSPEKVKEQAKEIAAVNKTMTDFKIFHGIESDILANGALDYDDDILGIFDFVVASIHSNFGLNEAAMTKRLVRAIKNPYTTMLGHPTGRLLLSREAYKLDLNAVIEAAGEHDVMIEINSHPQRLDLDWRFLRKAKEYGVKIVIGPDAHTVGGMEDFRYGVGVARKGWLTAADVVNTLDTEAVAELFQAKRTGK
jgi:DNA polymerase (family 10)